LKYRIVLRRKKFKANQNLCSFAWSKEPKIKAGESYGLWVMSYEWNLFIVSFEMIYFEMKSLFFCLIKRTKNQGCGKLWIRGYELWMKFICRELWDDIFWNEISVLFLDEKNQKSRLCDSYGLWKKLIYREFWDDIFWNEISVLFLDEKNQKSRLWYCC